MYDQKLGMLQRFRSFYLFFLIRGDHTRVHI